MLIGYLCSSFLLTFMFSVPQIMLNVGQLSSIRHAFCINIQSLKKQQSYCTVQKRIYN